MQTEELELVLGQWDLAHIYHKQYCATSAEKHDWFLCHQFETEANWKFHYDTTGPEICNDLKGTKLDYWVTGYGKESTTSSLLKYQVLYHEVYTVVKDSFLLSKMIL